MTPIETKEAFNICAAALVGVHIDPSNLAPTPLSTELKAARSMSRDLTLRDRHILWMCEEGKKLIDDSLADPTGTRSKLEKANRWLGFVQGYLWTTGVASIEEMRQWNMAPTAQHEAVVGTTKLELPPGVDVAVLNLGGITKMELSSKCRGFEIEPGVWSMDPKTARLLVQSLERALDSEGQKVVMMGGSVELALIVDPSPREGFTRLGSQGRRS